MGNKENFLRTLETGDLLSPQFIQLYVLSVHFRNYYNHVFGTNKTVLPVLTVFSRAKNSILGLYDGAKKTLKDIVEKEVEEEQQQEEDVDLTPHEHGGALKGAYRSFVISGRPKTDTDSYFDQTKPHIKTLIENHLKEMGPAKIIMTLWVVWKKSIRVLIKLGPEDAKNAHNLDDETASDIYFEKIEMPFNRLMTEFFDASNINDLIERMLVSIKAQTENPEFPKNGFILDKIMHLYINFHKLVLTRDSFYIEFSEWIKNKNH